MKKTIFEEMGGTYIRHGDYLIPCLALPKEEEQRFIGVWGQRHKRYLKEHKKVVYITLLTSGRLNSYLADIEEQAQERFERHIRTHFFWYIRNVCRRFPGWRIIGEVQPESWIMQRKVMQRNSLSEPRTVSCSICSLHVRTSSFIHYQETVSATI